MTATAAAGVAVILVSDCSFLSVTGAQQLKSVVSAHKGYRMASYFHSLSSKRPSGNHTLKADGGHYDMCPCALQCLIANIVTIRQQRSQHVAKTKGTC
jgi:hypothetical protein